MTKEALKLALETLESSRVFVMSRQMIKQPEGADWYDNRITAIKEALAQPERDPWREAVAQPDHIRDATKMMAQPEQGDRRLQIAMRQWEDWKTYALELQKKLVKYEGGSPMILNTQPEQEPVDFASLLREAEEIVQSKPTWKRFIDGTPLANDIAVWMAVFAQDVARRTSPPQRQPEERNFCPRCGKRTADLTTVHTCTPPQEKKK